MDSFWSILRFLGVGGKVGKGGHSYLCHRSDHMCTWEVSLVRARLGVLQGENTRNSGGVSSKCVTFSFINPSYSMRSLESLRSWCQGCPPWCWVCALPHALFEAELPEPPWSVWNGGQVVAPLQCPWTMWVPRESSFSLPNLHSSGTSW